MKAYIVKKYGKKEKLHLSDWAEPAVKENEVLVQIYSAGVNSLDALIRNGEFKLFLPYKPAFVNGHDMAGVVISTGSKVSRFKAGDEVYARVPDHHIGSFAEYIAVHENALALKPTNLSMEEAASIPLVGLTAWQALIGIGRLEKGQKLFIQAGSGGVGTFAIQLAKHVGAFVATTTSAKNMDLVKGLGADLVIDYKKDGYETKLQGYDMVLHSSKEKGSLDKSLQILKPGGQLISLVGPPTPEFATAIGLPWYLRLLTSLLSSGMKRKAKKGNIAFSFLFMRADGAQLSQITKLIEAGVIRPVIDKVFPFEQTNEALAYVEDGRAKGKVVIQVR